MIIHEDNSETTPVHHEPTPAPVPSWAIKPLCDWRFFSFATGADAHGHPQKPLCAHGVKLQNVPGPVVEAALDFLQALQTHDSGLGELARYVDARLTFTTKIFDETDRLVRADLYFTIHNDPSVSHIRRLFELVLQDAIVPYLEVHHWPIPPALRRPETDHDRFKEALPDSHALRELMENFSKVTSSPLGQALLMTWARMSNDSRGEKHVNVRVQGRVLVTIGDEHGGTLKHEAEIDQMLHQSIHSPIIFYLQKH